MHEFHVVDANELARAYAAAEYAARTGDGAFALRVGEPAPALEASWPATRYVLITAWNPASVPRSDAENQAADRQLCQRLESMALARVPATGEGPGGAWHEPGWLLADAEDHSLDALAREFGQAALLAWCAGEPVRLRMLVPRAAPAADLPCVDWVE